MKIFLRNLVRTRREPEADCPTFLKNLFLKSNRKCGFFKQNIAYLSFQFGIWCIAHLRRLLYCVKFSVRIVCHCHAEKVCNAHAHNSGARNIHGNARV